MQDEINVAIAVNEKYVSYAYVMLISLFENHRSFRVRLHVLYSDLTEKSLQSLNELGAKYGQQVNEIWVDKNIFPKELPCTDEWPREIYYRLALVDFLPLEIERIVYLDVDIIVINSIYDFYNIDFQGKSLAACPDMSALNGMPEGQKNLFEDFIGRPDFQYFNSGVLLMNLSKIRQNFKVTDFCDMALSLPLVSPDQDLLNYIFYGDVVLAAEERFNLFARLAYRTGYGYRWVEEHTAIIHYTGFKPWSYRTLHFELERFWWEYAKKAPFYVELLEEIVLNEIDTCFMDKLVVQMEDEKYKLLEALKKSMELLTNLTE